MKLGGSQRGVARGRKGGRKGVARGRKGSQNISGTYALLPLWLLSFPDLSDKVGPTANGDRLICKASVGVIGLKHKDTESTKLF